MPSIPRALRFASSPHQNAKAFNSSGHEIFSFKQPPCLNDGSLKPPQRPKRPKLHSRHGSRACIVVSVFACSGPGVTVGSCSSRTRNARVLIAFQRSSQTQRVPEFGSSGVSLTASGAVLGDSKRLELQAVRSQLEKLIHCVSTLNLKPCGSHCFKGT